MENHAHIGVRWWLLPGTHRSTEMDVAAEMAVLLRSVPDPVVYFQTLLGSLSLKYLERICVNESDAEGRFDTTARLPRGQKALPRIRMRINSGRLTFK